MGFILRQGTLQFPFLLILVANLNVFSEGFRFPLKFPVELMLQKGDYFPTCANKALFSEGVYGISDVEVLGFDIEENYDFL